MRFLIANGADLNLYNKDDETALYWAACNGCSSMLDLLLSMGAEPNIANKVITWNNIEVIVDKRICILTERQDGIALGGSRGECLQRYSSH